MAEVILNEFITTLDGAIDDDDTAITLTDAPPAEAGAADSWTLRIGDPVSDPATYEYARVTAVSGAVLTVVRGTDPAASSWADGTPVAAVIDRDALTAYVGENGGGGGDDPVFDSLGAPDTAFEFDGSSLTGLTAVGTPDFEDADTTVPGHYYVRDNAAGIALCGRHASVSAPFTAIARISDETIRADFNNVLMFIGEASPGKLVLPRVVGIARQLYVLTMNNPTGSGASDLMGPLMGQVGPPLYFAIVAHSTTDVDYAWSQDGRLWTRLSDAHNPGFTIGCAGIGIMSIESTFGVAAAFDYLRIWNSALTLPGYF
jgi:hypothetical protein